jgi:hypothetical protein
MVSKVTLSQQQVAANLQAQRSLNELLPVIDDAERCGVDVSGYRAIASGLGEQLRNLNELFSPQIKME